MCLAAILWAKIDKVYYGCNLADIAKIGFRDNELNKLLHRDSKLYEDLLEEKDREKCLKLFQEYTHSKKTIY